MTPELTDTLIFYSIAIVLCLLCSAFFSAAETAMTAVSRARIYQLVMDGNKAARVVTRLRREKEALIGSVLLGNNAVNIAASALATSVSLSYFGEDEGGLSLVISTVVMTVLVVVFTEVLPKTYAIHNAERVALRLAAALSVLVKVLYPFTKCIQLFISALFKLIKVDVTNSNTLISATDVIRGTIELHHREGSMIKQDRDMLGSILDLNDIEVGEIMIHRKDVETLNADLPVEELVEQAVSTMHSRIPLWQGEPDNIVGLLHIKNLVQALNQTRAAGKPLVTQDVLAICRKPWFIPETTSLRDQLLAFRSKRQHFAFVVDEYGGWRGVVTLEDIIEEIVGDIEDEHDEVETDIQKAGENVYYVSGGLSLRDLNRHLDWNLPDEHASTIAGLLIHEVQNIPAVGAQFDVQGLRFTVVSREGARITRLRIEKLGDLNPPEDVEL
ncbi:MAG: CNNM domain-containing protein [Rickettsiales bacterium]|nr:CNNM domain-containing protein [Rickettsiales bacterium]